MHNANLDLEFDKPAFEAGTLPRDKHLWHCQRRALTKLDSFGRPDLDGAFTSMMLDLAKHHELQKHSGIGLGMILMHAHLLDNEPQLRRWIEGFN